MKIVKQVFKGKLINLYIASQRFPGGYVASLEIIKHPGAVLIVPFLSRDKIVLIRQFRPVINSYIWELPAGTLDKNEKPLACAHRELIEEIGYEAGVCKRIGYIYPAPGYTTEKIYLYAATRLRKVEKKSEEDEDITPMIFYRKEVIRLLKNGAIVDAKTIAALTLAGIV